MLKRKRLVLVKDINIFKEKIEFCSRFYVIQRIKVCKYLKYKMLKRKRLILVKDINIFIYLKKK